MAIHVVLANCQKWQVSLNLLESIKTPVTMDSIGNLHVQCALFARSCQIWQLSDCQLRGCKFWQLRGCQFWKLRSCHIFFSMSLILDTCKPLTLKHCGWYGMYLLDYLISTSVKSFCAQAVEFIQMT